MKSIIVSVLAIILFSAGIAGLFAWESMATQADKAFYDKAAENAPKGMY